MLFLLFFWATIAAYCFARVEVQIEGKYGWAEKLPTWRIKNRFTEIFYFGYELTGYHLWQLIFITVLFHILFFAGTLWTLKKEFEILAAIIYFFTLEDFLWFVINPHFGIKKFKHHYIPWHHTWTWLIPTSYLLAVCVISSLVLSSSMLK